MCSSTGSVYRNAVKILLLLWSWGLPSCRSAMKVQGYGVAAGRHVCARDRFVNIPVQVTQTYCKPEYKRYLHSCNNGYYGMCSTFRLIYQLAYRKVYQNHVQKQRVYNCCHGWKRVTPYTTSCMKPVCSKGCGSGFCVQPDRCKCPAGWTGKDCKTDIDECKSGEHGCSHKCVNTEGSFSCTCSDGFSLGADGKSCEFCLSCSKEYKLLDKKLQKLSSEVENLQQENKALKSDLKAILHNATKVDLDPIGLKEFLTPETSSTKPTTKEAAATVVITTGKLPPVATTTMQPTRSPQESEVSFIFSNLKDMKTEMETRFYSMSAQLSVLEERLSDCICTGRRKRHNSKRKFWRSHKNQNKTPTN